ncbi:MAG: hypothetical protein R3F10_04875 [Lysobacteraceae bacterium]
MRHPGSGVFPENDSPSPWSESDVASRHAMRAEILAQVSIEALQGETLEEVLQGIVRLPGATPAGDDRQHHPAERGALPFRAGSLPAGEQRLGVGESPTPNRLLRNAHPVHFSIERYKQSLPTFSKNQALARSIFERAIRGPRYQAVSQQPANRAHPAPQA